MTRDFQRLRIGLVGPLPPPFGGMGNQTRQLARLLRKEGTTVYLIQVNAPYCPAWIADVKGVRAFFRLIPYLVELWTTAGKVDLFHVMANSGWSWHLFAAPAIWIGRLRNTPVIVNYRGGGADSFVEKSFLFVDTTLKRAERIVVPSGFLQQVFARWDISTSIVPNIVDLSRFNSGVRANEEAKPRRRVNHIIVTRNLEQIYDIGTAIRAYHLVRRHLPEARLTIAGCGSQRRKLEVLVAELGIADKVVFTGRLNSDQMARLYHSAGVMVNPSTIDNMPNSVLEALASGVPVVSTSVGGVPYLVENGETALLVPVGDVHAMADALVKVLTDDKLAERLSLAGLETAQRYTWPQVKKLWLETYEACVVS